MFSKTLGTPAFMGGWTAGVELVLAPSHPVVALCMGVLRDAYAQAHCIATTCHHLTSHRTSSPLSSVTLQHLRCGRGSSTTACRQTCGPWASPSTPSSSGTCPSRQAACDVPGCWVWRLLGGTPLCTLHISSSIPHIAMPVRPPPAFQHGPASLAWLPCTAAYPQTTAVLIAGQHAGRAVHSDPDRGAPVPRQRAHQVRQRGQLIIGHRAAIRNGF